MPRDYKHRRRKKRSQETPGWVWMFYGLGLGLAVALGVYLHDRRQDGPLQPVPNRSATPASQQTTPADGEDQNSGPRLDFYDLLPNFEVVIPERETVQEERRPSPAGQTGTYVLQAGSFRNLPDADRMKAELTLLGFEPRIERVTIDADTWHRVRVGPVHDLDRANRIRDRLRQADIDVLVIRIPK